MLVTNFTLGYKFCFCIAASSALLAEASGLMANAAAIIKPQIPVNPFTFIFHSTYITND
jgi:hypothetical protein